LKRLLAGIAVAACLAWAQEAPHAPDHAKAAVEHGEGHEEAPMPNEIWWKWANFAVLAGGLAFLIAKNAGPFFQARTTEIQKGIRDAAAVRAEAEARAAQIEKQIANLDAEVSALKAKSGEEIAREGERVSAETARLIEKVQRQSEAEIAAAAKNASQDLKAYSAELALRMAEQQIQQRMTQQNQDQLAEAFVDDIRRKAELN
jgi:F-type H+-transporting ATPase subunit b